MTRPDAIDPPQDALPDAVWADVMRKMDETWSDLMTQQVALERKNADLEAMRAFMNSVLGAMTDVLIVCDPSGRVVEVNDALERETSIPRAEATGSQVADLFAEDSRVALTALIDSARRRVSVPARELDLIGHEGPIPLDLSAAPRRDERGRISGIVLLGRPVGELRRAYRELEEAHEQLKQAQAQLVQSEKLASLGRLVAGVAHELNNPISFVYGNAHALERYVGKLEAYFEQVRDGASRDALVALRSDLKLDRAVDNLRGAVGGALEGAERVRDIVNDLRRFSAANESDRQPYDLVATARTAAFWVLKGERRDVALSFTGPEALEITGHSGHTQQIVMNLVQNALDAMEGEASPILTVDFAETADRATLTIRDSGPGIAAEALPHLFDPFFTTKPVGKGTGLGLSISYKLASDQGGTLEAENHPEGGAVFCLTLPRAIEAAS